MRDYNLGSPGAGCTVAGLVATLLVVAIVLFGYADGPPCRNAVEFRFNV